MTGSGAVTNGTHNPVTAFPTESLMGIVKMVNEILMGILSFFGGGGG